MILLRDKYFSGDMIEKITTKLEQEGIGDYEVSDRIPTDVISITGEPNGLKIYIPRDYEYSQYEIDDFIRTQAKFVRTNTNLERNIYVMKLTGSLTFPQMYKLVKFIIDEEGFCTLLTL